MKKYLFTNLAATWWAEYQVDGMQTTDNQRVLGIRSMSVGGTINPTDIDSAMAAIGLPTHYGGYWTEVEMVAFATANNLNLTMIYEDVAGVAKYAALVVQTTPTFSPVAGPIAFGATVTIASASADAIYYTLDGNVPTILSTRQSVTPCVILAEGTVKAIAVRAGFYQSVVGVAAYTQALAAAPTSVTLAVGGATPVGGVVNVVIPAAEGTDSTGQATGWVTGTANKIKVTVVDAASTASTMTINGGAYVSGADYAITAVGTLTLVLTTTRANYKTVNRTFLIAVTA
jgi:hypothetical protein